jgi:hypothetical protein
MILKRLALFSAVVGIGLSSAAFADHLFYNRYVGQYLSVDAGVSYAHRMYVNGKTNNNVLGGATAIFLGDLINPYFGPEVALQYFDLPQMGGLILLNLNGRFTQSIGQSVSLFEKLGIGLSELRTCYQGCQKTDIMSPTFGVGVGLGITPLWMTSLEFNGTYLPEETGNGSGLVGAVTFGATRYFNM